MSGYIANIEDATTKNSDYRRVLFTAKHTQLVLMNLKPGEEIGGGVERKLDRIYPLRGRRRFRHSRRQDTSSLRRVCGRHTCRYET